MINSSINTLGSNLRLPAHYLFSTRVFIGDVALTVSQISTQLSKNATNNLSTENELKNINRENGKMRTESAGMSRRTWTMGGAPSRMPDFIRKLEPGYIRSRRFHANFPKKTTSHSKITKKKSPENICMG